MKKLITRLSVVLALLIFVVVLFILSYSFPKKINVERTAVLFTPNNPSSAKKTLIKVRGTLYKPLLRQKKFTGYITLAAFDFTKEQKDPLYFSDGERGGINRGTLIYLSSSPPFSFKQTDMIWFDDKFVNINIWLNNDSFIVTGSNYEQAKKTQTMLRNKYDDDSWFVPH